MSDRNIDNAYKKAFPKQEYSYKPEYWAQMEASMGPAAPRVPSWWWKAASAVLAVATTASVWFWNSNEQGPVLADKNQTQVESTSVQNANNSSNEELNSKSVASAPAAATLSEGKTSLSSGIESTSAQAESASMDQVEQTSEARSEGSHSIQPDKASKASSLFSKEKQSKSVQKAAIQQAGFALSSPKKSNQQQAVLGAGSSSLAQAERFSSTSESESAIANVEVNETVANDNALPRMPFRDATLFAEGAILSPDLSTSQSSASNIARNPFKMPKLHFYFGASAGYSMLNNDNNLLITPSGNYRDLTMDMYRNQSMEVGVDFGVKYRNFLVQSGLKYSNLSQAYEMNFIALSEQVDMDISERRVIKETLPSPNSKLIIVPGPDNTFDYRIDTVYDTAWAIHVDTNYFSAVVAENQMYRSSYTIDYAQIPLYIGYELPLKDFYLHLSTGMDMAVLVSATGTVYDPETQSVIAQLDKSELNPVLWKYRLNLGIGYNVNDRVSLYLNPSYSRSLNTAYKEDHSYSGQFSGYGLNAGLRYQF
ncbi:outer membrane beta-barrel protein [bacterium SCSIO 12741]|nr:outer membrane beta-barrel protein [bacterium SCSIO 12741]